MTVTDEQKAELEEQFTQLEQNLAGQGATIQMATEAQGISEQGFRTFMEESYLVSNLFEKLSEEGGPLVPTDESMAAYLEESGTWVEHICSPPGMRTRMAAIPPSLRRRRPR